MYVVHPILGVTSTKSVSYIIILLKRSITKWWRIHCHISLLQISLERDISNYQLPSLQGLAMSSEVIHGSLSLTKTFRTQICQDPRIMDLYSILRVVILTFTSSRLANGDNLMVFIPLRDTDIPNIHTMYPLWCLIQKNTYTL